MKDFKYYLSKINEKSFKDYPFQLYHAKDNMRTAKGFNSKEEALKYALDNNINEFDIFKNGTGFHSTTQDEFLVLWADKTGKGYFSNRAAKEPELLKKKYEINERWDPSMSNSSDAPWNQTSFVEQNEDMLEYLENKLGYSKDEIEDFMSGNGYNAWETDIENLWPDLYSRTLIAGYDDAHDAAIYNDAYNKIEAEVKKSTGSNYKKYKYELKKALDKYVVDTCLEDLRNLYLNHIPKNETVTTFNVPTLIQLYYVEDANKKAVGLYKDLETAERLEMQSKGKKYIINIDRDDYNSGKINASNAKNYIPKNESGELVPVQAGEIIKLQKPAQDTYTNKVMNNDGIEIADCTVCGAPGVIVTDHICKTVIEPTDQVPSEYNMVENRFESIRSKYGVNESKMITKIDWFKAILESPEPEEKNYGHTPKSEISMSEQEIANEVIRLFDRYNNDEMNADVKVMFPDYKTVESEDAAYHVIDMIYDNETISDAVWKALKPGLLLKFKNYFENDTLNENFNMSNFVVLPNGDLEININGIESDVLAEMNLYQGTDEQFLWQFFESNLTNGYNLVPEQHKGLTEAPMISDEFIDEETDITNTNVWAFMDYMVASVKDELLKNGKVIFKKV